ncbi:cytochrome P450 [Mycena albidolilacea]|uniref:Cytochrome P450 n=1 Tax=Mycena albidolilacea TaxID=1033008 RepID=A0AAD7E968_9AGAR|nr:cytochrome P450 [Mycena albidolilacea]
MDALRTVVLCTFFIILTTLYAVHLCARRHKLPLPPGPPKLPLVGNLFDVPSTFQWKSYARWSKQYDSDIIHLDLAGTSVIVLSSFEATDALFEKRSSLYSDRRTHRRLFNGAFNVKASRKYEPVELVRTHVLLARLLHAPEDFMHHLRQMAGEIIMTEAYGIDVLPSDDPYVTLAHKAGRAVSSGAVPGAYLVDTFPILKHIPRWFPGAGFKRQAEEWSKLSRGMLELPFAETKRQMQTAVTMYIGGADTIVFALGTFVLAMLACPEVQKKAQAEIDSLTGGRYLPSFEDEASLPYISALVKEVMRWENVTPFAIPRLLANDDEYRGYRLPAGSVVVRNAWAILHDERVYPDPHTFKPERFLLDGKLNPAVRNPEPAFGFGRRLCPGRHMALSSIWITVVSILATFDINKAVDERGNVIEPSYEYLSGLVSAPVPFKCSITPRSQETIALIQGAAGGEQRL